MPKLSDIKKKSKANNPLKTDVRIGHIDESISEIFHDVPIDKKQVTNGQQTDNKRVTIGQQKTKDKNKQVTKQVTKQITNGQQTGNKRVAKQITNPSIFDVTGNERKLLNFIFQICRNKGSKVTPCLTLDLMLGGTNISSKGVLKMTILRLVNEKSVLEKSQSKTGRGGWVKFKIPDHIYQELIFETDNKQVTNGQQTGNKQITKQVTEQVTNPPSSSISFNNINNKLTTMEPAFNPAEVPGQQQLGPQFDNDWQNIDISPLQSIGFTNHHLSQLFTKNMLTPKQVQDSINAFAFDLYENKRGEKIKTSPLNLFMGILKGGNEYNPPKNFESEEDRILREQVEAEREKLEKRQQMQSELKELKYKNWLLDLSVDKKLDILDVPLNFFEKMPVEAIESGLKKHFEMKVL